MPSSKKDSDYKSKIETGKKYEKLAALYYEQLGYTILEMNWRTGRKEVDLIVCKNKEIIFVEVKSSASTKFGHPSERVDKRKIANLTEAANQYIISRKIDHIDLRFDVVTFTKGQLEHFPNAFNAG